MRKILISSASALALLAGTVAVPSSANAYPVWVIPVIIGAAVGGVGLGAVATANAQQNGQPVPAAQPGLEPRARVGFCHMARARVDGVWRRVEVCD